MSHARSLMVSLFLLLFVGLSFNAYACLVPLYDTPAAAMGNGCSSSDQQPVRQFCDAFKTLSVQSADKLHLNSDCQTLCPEDTASLSLLVILTSPSSRLSDHLTVSSPQDLLLKISVLRI